MARVFERLGVMPVILLCRLACFGFFFKEVSSSIDLFVCLPACKEKTI